MNTVAMLLTPNLDDCSTVHKLTYEIKTHRSADPSLRWVLAWFTANSCTLNKACQLEAQDFVQDF